MYMVLKSPVDPCIFLWRILNTQCPLKHHLAMIHHSRGLNVFLPCFIRSQDSYTILCLGFIFGGSSHLVHSVTPVINHKFDKSGSSTPVTFWSLNSPRWKSHGTSTVKWPFSSIFDSKLFNCQKIN